MLMKLSARNQLKGKIVEVKKGGHHHPRPHRHRWSDPDRLDHERGGGRVEACRRADRLRRHQGDERNGGGGLNICVTTYNYAIDYISHLCHKIRILAH
jgi:hypothetical protein